MVHKKYIKQGDKVFGPYLYETKRVNGKVVTTYIGKHVEKKRNLIIPYFIIGFILLALLIFVGFQYQGITGRAIFEQVRTFGDVVLGDSDSVEEVEDIIDEPLEEEIPEEEIEEEELEESEKAEEEVVEIEEKPEEDVFTEDDNVGFVDSSGIVSNKSVGEEIIDNRTVDDSIIKNDIIVNETKDNETLVKEDIFVKDANVTNVTESIYNETEFKKEVIIETTREQIRVGELVKWAKNISLNIPQNVTIKLPAEAKNIIIKKLDRGQEKELESNFRLVTEKAISDVARKRGFFGWLSGIARITGFVVSEEVIEEKEAIFVVLEDEETTKYIIEYETPAPEAFEEETSTGKRVVISGPDDLGYTDILSFVEIPEVLELGRESEIVVYWVENDSSVPFNAFDLDNNGKLDYVEWITSHLSNQTFDIILIIKAEHLDENRTFISDIFESVRELDNNWSETIPDTHYVRVTFEIPLDSTRDITIFPRTVLGEPRIEVYEFNGTEIIAEFTSLQDNQYNKVFLTNLISESQDVFDLRIVGGDVEFDHIIDPTEEFFEACTDPIDITIVWDVTGTADNLWQEGAGGNNNQCWAENGFSNMTIKTAIDLTGVSYANLTFDRNCDNLEGGDHLKAYVNSSAESWQLLLDTANNDPVTEEFDLSNNITMTTGVYIRFELDVTANNEDCTLDNINVTSYIAADNEFPIFSNFQEVPTNNTAYVSGAIYEFNVTITSTNTTAGLEFNATNYTASNLTATVFNVTISDLAAGTYSYYWWAYGNGTSNNFNSTELRYYTVAKATGDVEVYLNNATANVTVELGTSVQINASRLTGEGTFTLYEDGTAIAEGTATINSTTANNVGSINITAILSETQNYTADSQERFIDVEDTTAPDVTINFPTNVTYNNADLPLNFNVSTSENSTVIYSLDGGINNVTMLYSADDVSIFGDEFNSTNDSIADGGYVFQVYANDTAGNNNYTENITFSVEVTVPLISFVAPTPADGANFSSDSINVTVTVTEANEDTINFSLYNDTATINSTVFTDGTRNINWTGLADGNYTYNVTVNDTAGNFNSTETRIILLDTIVPLISYGVGTEVDGANVTQSNIYVNVTFTETNFANITFLLSNETNSSINSTTFTTETFEINWTGLAVGNYTYNVSIYDVSSNFNSTASRLINLSAPVGPSDNEFPIFSSFQEVPTNNTAYVSGAIYEFNVTITSTNTTAGLEFNATNYTASNLTATVFNVTISNLAAGTYSYYWWAYGNGTSNNFNSTELRYYTVAKATGDVEVYLNNATTNVTVELGTSVQINASRLVGEGTFTLYEDGTAIAEGTATINSTTANNVGSINITAILSETQNYTADSQERFIDVEDTILPLVDIVTPDNSTNHSISNVNVNYTVSDLDLQACWYTNSSGQFNYTITCGNNLTTQTWDQGDSVVTVYANDSAGNENSSSVTFFVDSIIPLIDYTTGTQEDGVNISSDSIFVNVTVTETNEDTITFRLYNSTSEVNTTAFTDATRSINFTSLPDETYTYNVTVNDTIGNENITATGTITLDATNPIINYVSPTQISGASLNQNYIEINVTATDDNLETLEIRLYNSTQDQIEINTSTTSPFFINYSSLSDGLYFYNATANDTIGNEANLGTRNITLDSINPSINLTYPLNITYTTVQTQLNYTVSDANLETCWYSTDGGVTNTTVTCGNNVTGLDSGQGSSTWTVYVNDSANNENSSSVTFFVDSIAPTIDFVSPTETDGSFITRTEILINVTSSDDNLKNITIRLYNSTQDQIEINTSTTSPFFINYSGLGDELYFFNATAIDIANTQNSTGTRNVTIDTANPSVIDLIPSESSAFNTSTSIEIAANVTDDTTSVGAVLVNITLPNSTINRLTLTNDVDNKYNVSFSIPELEGRYNLTFIANDTVNNINSSETTFFNATDVTAPLVTINVPENITYSTSSFDFNVSLNEDGDTVQYTLDDGINNITMSTTDNRVYNATNDSIADGGYTFQVYANDTIGNNNYTESVTFTIDTSVDGGTTTGGTTGGGGTPPVIDFSINKDLINVKIKQGETKREIIVIENTGNRNQQFNLSIEEIERFVILSEESFTLSSGDSKEINADFFASENEPPDVHAGRIIVRTGPIKKSINVILEIREKAALFDTRSELADIALTKSQKLKVKINMTDIGDLNKRVDVVLEYFIKDFEGTEIKLGEETIGVFGSLVIERKFSIPNWLEPGDYLFFVKLTYLDSVATSANRFTIEKEPSFITFIRENFVIVVIVILLIILFMVIRLRKLVIRRYLIRYYLSSIYVEYLRIKYELVLIWVKYKAGLYQEKILTIKHLPINILGTIKNYINKIHALYLQDKYDKKMKLSNEQEKSKEQKKKSSE